jgi:transposase
MSDSQERNFIDKVLKPTDQEKKESKFYRKRGEAYQQYIEKQGLSEFLKRITEEKAAEENKSVEEIQKLNLKPQELTGGASEKVLKKYKVVKMPEAEIETPAPKNM